MLSLKKGENANKEERIVDHIRSLSIDMINEASFGHPGIALGAAPILYTLYAHHLKFSVTHPKWINRDRFILSGGHGSALLYAILFFAGFDITLEDLKQFRKIDSITPGHPEYGVTPGVDMSTGPLGQGLATSVGMAMGERFLASTFNTKKEEIFDYYTYVLCGEGDLMEGVSYEALSLAGTLKLHKLIVLYDANNITLDGNLDLTFQENISDRMSALGFNVLPVVNGDDLIAIDKAITKAKGSVDKPSFIPIKTTIGKYSKWQGTNKVHGSVLEEDDITSIKEKLEIRDIPFSVSNEAVMDMRDFINKREVEEKYQKWLKMYENLDKKTKLLLDSIQDYDSSFEMEELYLDAKEENMTSLREVSSKMLNAIAKSNPFFLGGASDVSSSVKTYLNDLGDYSRSNYQGKNIWFGVREHAMGAILNGLALSGLAPFGSTFLAFSDYLKPALRMAAMMELPITYVFTHDSISVGSDGPTHQPVEQLVSLRSIPNVEVFRPADANEVIGTYQAILAKKNSPSVIVLSRNDVPVQSTTSIPLVAKGAYVVRPEERNLSGVIIATGEEVNLAIKVASRLMEKGIDLRVVSMTSIERFLKQSNEYQESILPVATKIVVIEAASSYSWYRFVYNDKYLITQDHFGYSGTKDEVIEKCGFDFDNVLAKVEKLFK